MSKGKKVDLRKNPGPIGSKLNFASTEAYNLLRINVSFSLPDKEGTKVIGVTSPSPQEGKSYTSINLAYALAEANNRVLLIDTDLRRPSVAKTLGIAHTAGLSNYLVNQEKHIIHRGVLSPNLCVITSGDIPPNPSELVSSEAMRNMLKSFENNFDYILLDLPPVNAVADPLAIAPTLDGIIVVVRHGYTKRSDAMEAVRQIQFTKANILGFVYNCSSSNGKGYYRRKSKYYYRNSYRRYGYESAAVPSNNISLEDALSPENVPPEEKNDENAG